MNKGIRSPFFYVGDKYKLMPQLNTLIPKDIDVFIEPFVGGGSGFLNTPSNRYIANDINPYVIKLHQFITSFANNKQKLFDELYQTIEQYQLSCSYLGKTAPDDLKKQFVKTYYAKYNKQSYLNLRDDFNKNKDDLLKLYLLLIYGFNHMIRFNGRGDFNLPVGNVDFNQNVVKALNDYLDFMTNHDVVFNNQDYQQLLNQTTLTKNSYIYFDPPYLISSSEYNKIWNIDNEIRLYQLLDDLNHNGIRFGITNLINHKGHHNEIFYQWAKKYDAYDIKSNYISFNNNHIKTDSQELFVTNHHIHRV